WGLTAQLTKDGAQGTLGATRCFCPVVAGDSLDQCNHIPASDLRNGSGAQGRDQLVPNNALGGPRGAQMAKVLVDVVLSDRSEGALVSSLYSGLFRPLSLYLYRQRVLPFEQ